MASIYKRGKKYSVVYRFTDENGKSHQKWETFDTLKDADRRKKEIEYKQAVGKFEVPKCTTVKEVLDEYVKIYGYNKWGVSTYDGNMGVINNYIIPTIGNTRLSDINNHFMEKYYKELLNMPAVKSSRNMNKEATISTSTVNEIHKILRKLVLEHI